jgi:hypothetical protein
MVSSASPALAQLVEHWTVVRNKEVIQWSLVRIRQAGQVPHHYRVAQYFLFFVPEMIDVTMQIMVLLLHSNTL